MENFIKTIIALLTLIFGGQVSSAEYKIDTKGMHAAVLFKISHLGTSWIHGRFDKLEGKFRYNKKNPNESAITMTVDTRSINTNHAERDKHLRDKKILDVNSYPNATFVSTKFKLDKSSNGIVTGLLTLHGVKKVIDISIVKVGEGNDPWGGHRVGFEGSLIIKLADYGITKFLGKTSKTLELTISIEGIRTKR